MSLHPPVLFIGDRPNPKKNLDMDTPFVGTKSYKTLLEWIYRMDIDIRQVEMMNAYRVDGQPVEWKLSFSQRIVALGKVAGGAVANKTPKFFQLPHPSGLNIELNDKKKLAEQLALCRAFIYKKT